MLLVLRVPIRTASCFAYSSLLADAARTIPYAPLALGSHITLRCAVLEHHASLRSHYVLARSPLASR